MGLLFILVAGAGIGWFASVWLHVESTRGVLLEIGAGIVGALAGGLSFAPIFNQASLLSENYSIPALLMTVAGSAAAVGLLNRFNPEGLR